MASDQSSPTLGSLAEPARRPPKYCGEVAGTYGYMAPEVLRGGTVSPLSDLYSLGALAYRLLGGPPERRSAAAAKLSAGVADVIDRALEPDPDPDARQSSVAEFRAQLLAAHGSPGLVQSRAA